VFGIGPQELIIIGLLALVVFGPKRLPSMAKDLGRFVNEARNTVEEFKEDLITDEVEEVRRTAKEIKRGTRQIFLEGAEATKVASHEEDRNEPAASGPGANGKRA
jgi:sec-independent protein translocase protein TatB